MHGVAYDADIIGAKLNDFGNRNGREELIQSPARVINNSWGSTGGQKGCQWQHHLAAERAA